MKICVAAVEALRKNEKKDETQVFLESHPCMIKLKVLVPAFSLLYWPRDYRIGSNFWKFYLIRTGELSFLAKVFRLFKIGTKFFGVQSVYTM